MKKLNAVLFILILLIPAVISYRVRSNTADMPITDDWAKSTVFNYYAGQIRAQITAQFPNLPEEQIQAQINQQMNSQIVSNPQVKQQIQDVSQTFKNAYRYNDDKYLYMPDIDPYEYLKETQDIVDHGHIGDVQKEDGYWYNMHALAPTGQKIYIQDLHPRVLAWFYKIGHFFDKSLDVMQTSMYVSSVFVSIATLFVFLLLRRYSGIAGALFGATLYGIHPVILTRTLWGHADTDIWQVLFIPMAFYFASEMLMSQGKRRYLFALLGGLSLGLFSFSWNQWYYAFDILLGVIAIHDLVLLRSFWKEINSGKSKKEAWSSVGLNNEAMVILIFLASTAVFVSLFGLGGFASFLDAPFVIFSNFQIKEASYGSLWPNVYTTVAELAPISFNGIVGILGKMWLTIALIGLAFALWKKEWVVASATSFLFVAGLIASIVAGTRFTLFLGFPLALGVGLGLGYAYEYLNKWALRLI